MQSTPTITIKYIDLSVDRLAKITIQTDTDCAQYTLPPVNCVEEYLSFFYRFISPIPSNIEEAQLAGWTATLVDFDGAFKLTPPADTPFINPFERLHNWASANVRDYDFIELWEERHNQIDFWGDLDVHQIEYEYDIEDQGYYCSLGSTDYYPVVHDSVDLTHLFRVLDIIDYYARRDEYPYCDPFDGPAWIQGN